MDIYSPRGKRAVEIARERLRLVAANLGVDFVPFQDKFPCPYDGVLIKDGFVKAAYEVRTRNAKIEDGQLIYRGRPYDSIIITASKLDTCVKVAASSYLPFYLIMVFTNETLMWEVSDHYGRGQLGELDKRETKTRKNINGGVAKRENYFIPLSKSKKLLC